MTSKLAFHRWSNLNSSLHLFFKVKPFKNFLKPNHVLYLTKVYLQIMWIVNFERVFVTFARFRRDPWRPVFSKSLSFSCSRQRSPGFTKFHSSFLVSLTLICSSSLLPLNSKSRPCNNTCCHYAPPPSHPPLSRWKDFFGGGGGTENPSEALKPT